MGGPEAHLFVPLLYYYLSRPGSWEPFKILLFIEHSLEIQQILFPKFQSEGCVIFLNRVVPPCHVDRDQFTESNLSTYKSTKS